MTLKDLVMRFNFDSLSPYLEEDIKGDDYVLYAFRQAYDALRRMEPNPDYKDLSESNILMRMMKRRKD